MGRIKSLMVKKAAKQLLLAQAENYTEDFDHNKRVLASNLPSKPIRNKVAGYIARLVKMKRIALEKPVEVPSSA